MFGEALPRLVCRKRRAGVRDWAEAEPVFLRENVNGAEPAQATWLKTGWDDQRLHLLFHAEDTEPWATLTAHDSPLYTEEVVEIFLDPSGDLECYFEIEVNPLNTVLDVVLRRIPSGYRKDFRWHCEGLETAVKTGADWWEAEISIPFESLEPGCGGAGKMWRANFFRIDRPMGNPVELSAWSPTRCRTFHSPRKFGFLEFAECAFP